MFRLPVDLSGILEVMDVIPEGLFIPGKFIIRSIFDEFLFQDIING